METDRVLADAFLASHPAEAAREIERHPLPAVGAFLCDCPADDLARVVTAMDPAVAAAALGAIDVAHAAGIVAELPPVAASVLLRRVAADPCEQILQRMPPRAAAHVRRRLQYPAGCAGALLDPAVLTASSDMTVADMRQRLRRADLRAEAHVFVMDADGVLRGVVDLGELVNAAPDARAGAIARRHFEAIQATAGRAAVLTHPAWRELHTLPVVDASGHLLGVLRHTALDALAAESSRPAGSPVIGAALAFGELAWLAGSALADELAKAFSARDARRRKEPVGR